MKKLCMVVFNYYEIDSRVKRHAEFLADCGWHIDIIALKSHFEKSMQKFPTIRVYEIPIAKKRGSFIRYIYQYLVFCILSFILLTCLYIRNRYLLIQINNLPDFLVFSALIPRLAGCPVLLDMHEITPEFFSSKYGVNEKHPLIRFLILIERLCTGFSSHVITVNDAIRELLISRGLAPEKISTILDSADERLFVPKESPPNRDTFVLMYHGTLTEIYGIDTAIRSLGQLSEEARRGLEMRIAGEGPEEEHLKELTRDLGLESSVRFLGNYPLEEIPDLINQCDAGICPTANNELTEYSLSTKLMEYIYMDKPIIASRLKTYMKYFDDSCIAYFTPGDEKECSEKILSLAHDRELRAHLARNAKIHYRDLSWNSIKDHYHGVVTSLTGK
jgi:glycosyltransferase involved in cell wall biosynthesis